MGEGINRALAEALEREPEMMLLGQDIGAYGGTFGVTRGLYDRYGHDTVRDAPLCESATVGFAIGLAVSGVRSVVELEFFDFIGVAMDQVFNQAAKLHYFTGGRAAGAAGHPGADRGPHGHGPAALAEPRVLVHAHPRPEDRDAGRRARTPTA